MIKATGKSINGFDVFRVESGAFEGVEFTYGAISISEDEDNCTLSFEHSIISGIIVAKDEFEKMIGDFLLSIIEKQLDNNDVVYTGGK